MYTLYCNESYLSTSSDKYTGMTIDSFMEQDHKREFTKAVSCNDQVAHDIENVDKRRSFGNVIGTDLAGYHFIGDFCFLGVSCGGDWEIPIFMIVYIDGDGALRSYVPTAGNCFNIDTHAAFGNEDEPISPEFWAKHASKGGNAPLSPEDNGAVNTDNVAVCSEWVLRDIKQHFGLSESAALDANVRAADGSDDDDRGDLRREMRRVISSVAPEVDNDRVEKMVSELTGVINGAGGPQCARGDDWERQQQNAYDERCYCYPNYWYPYMDDYAFYQNDYLV